MNPKAPQQGSLRPPPLVQQKCLNGTPVNGRICSTHKIEFSAVAWVVLFVQSALHPQMLRVNVAMRIGKSAFQKRLYLQWRNPTHLMENYKEWKVSFLSAAIAILVFSCRWRASRRSRHPQQTRTGVQLPILQKQASVDCKLLLYRTSTLDCRSQLYCEVSKWWYPKP